MGLNSVRELLKRLSNPQDDLKFVHIAGTNGKGSVLAYLTSILKQAGYKVGHYSSPPINSYREVIQVNDKYIDQDAIAHYITIMKPFINSMLADGLPHPTRFEMEAALAFLYYREQACDLVLLETGLGGLDDATNIVQTTILEIITSVSMDHMAILGETLEEIALQKAGIIKKDTVVISIKQNHIIEDVLERTCRDKHCSLVLAEPDNIKVTEYGIEKQTFDYISKSGKKYTSISISLAGIHQFKNAVVAIEAVEALNKLGYTISSQHLINGFKDTRWKGRFTIICKNPLVIIDGAHNEDAARQLAGSIELYFKDKRIIYILGIFRDKEYEKIIQHTIKYADMVITINAPEIERLLPANELAAVIKKYHNKVMPSINIEDAVAHAFREAGPNDVIIAFGSLSFLGAVEKLCIKSAFMV